MIEYGGALEAAQAAAQLLVPRSQLTRWHNDPVLFAKECIRWPVIDGVHTELLEYQAQAMGDLVQYGRVAVRAPHAAGKSATNAILVLWFAITRDLAGIDWKCLTTAGAWFHLERALWPEIHLWAGRIRWDVVGREPLDPARELLTTILKLQHGQAFAAATDNPQLIEGLHASAILLILDEAKAIPAPIFDALEGALMGAGEVYALTSSTPEAPSGRFYEICTQQRGLSDWHPIHITLEMAIKAGKIKREMAEQRKLQWGESSSIYQNRVLGEFASQDEDSVIPLAWVEQAMARWRIWHDNGSPDLSGRLVVGVDVADQGDDKTAIALRQGDVVREVRVYSKAEPMETAGYVMAAMESQFPRHDDAVCIIDAIGIGAGVLGRLREQRKQVIAFNPQAVSVRRDRTGSMGFVDCLVAEDRVAPIGSLEKVYRSWYEGTLYRVQMASGDHFTATPNHQVLARRGWVRVKNLAPGDDLLSASWPDETDSVVPDIDQVPASFGEIYGTASQLHGTQRVPSRRVDFHGDRPVGDVDIVVVNSDLLSVGETSGQESQQLAFSRALHGFGLLALLRGMSQHLRVLDPGLGDRERPRPRRSHHDLTRHGLATAEAQGFERSAGAYACFEQALEHNVFADAEPSGQGSHRSAREVFDGYRGARHPSEPLLSLLTTPFDSRFSENAPNNGGLSVDAQRQRANRCSGSVALDQVVSVEIIESCSQFVYTLQTATGTYRTSSVTHRNCKAEAWWHLREMLDPRPVPDPNNPQVLVPTCRVCLPDTPELIGDLCTPKWKITSQGRIQIESKADIRKRLSRSTDLGDACVQCFVISGANSAVDFTQAAKWREGRDLDPRGIRTAVRYDSGGREVAGHAARGRWGPYGE